MNVEEGERRKLSIVNRRLKYYANDIQELKIFGLVYEKLQVP